MSDLTSFLRARLDEDEADAHDAAQQIHFPAQRLLAEVQAKRRILKRCRESNGYWGAEIEAMLAVAYSDHPDYDEAWRP